MGCVPPSPLLVTRVTRQQTIDALELALKPKEPVEQPSTKQVDDTVAPLVKARRGRKRKQLEEVVSVVTADNDNHVDNDDNDDDDDTGESFASSSSLPAVRRSTRGRAAKEVVPETPPIVRKTLGPKAGGRSAASTPIMPRQRDRGDVEEEEDVAGEQYEEEDLEAGREEDDRVATVAPPPAAVVALECPCCGQKLYCSNTDLNRHLDFCLSGRPDPSVHKYLVGAGSATVLSAAASRATITAQTARPLASSSSSSTRTRTAALPETKPYVPCLSPSTHSNPR